MNEQNDRAEQAQTNGDPEPAQTNGDPEQAKPAGSAKSGASKLGGSRAEERIAALDTEGASLAAQVEELRNRLEAAERRVAEAEAGWQRARADYANLKRRTEEQRAESAGIASDRLLIRVLDLADDFDLAVEHVPAEAAGTPWVEGISAIDRKLRQLLEAEGIESMSGEGEPFDPQTQQAISYEDSNDVPDGTVLKILQRGFTIHGRVLRPALVAVARNEEAAAAAADDDDDNNNDDDNDDD